jgi:pimeloyl-ACP methyl ester carboxylesterase
MLLDAAVAGIEPWDAIAGDPAYWPIRFHQAPDLAERLAAGQEAIYFAYLLRAFSGNPGAIGDEDVERYASAYDGPGQLAAAMRMFRAFPANERFGRQKRGALDVEFTLVGGAVPGKGLGPRLDAIAEGLARAGVNPPRSHRIAGSGHYLLDEKPAEVAGLIARQAAKGDREPLPANTGRFDRFAF